MTDREFVQSVFDILYPNNSYSNPHDNKYLMLGDIKCLQTACEKFNELRNAMQTINRLSKYER